MIPTTGRDIVPQSPPDVAPMDGPTTERTIDLADTDLDALSSRIERGETIVIARHGVPFARMSPVTSHAAVVRVPGALAGKVWLDPEFWDPLTDDELTIRDL